MGVAGRAQPTVNVAPARNAVLFFLKYLRLAYLRLALEARPMLRLPFQREVSYVVVLYVVAASRRGAAARSLVAAGDVVLLQCAASSHRSCTRVETSARCVDALEAFCKRPYTRANALSEARR